MLGVFDSGVGGLTALAVLRKTLKSEDIVFLADKENAPYGTKNSNELIALVKRNIKRLCDFGATKILIACCTASTVYDRLSKEERDICHPIISPTANAAARATKSGRVGVIATKATVRSHAFRNALLNHKCVRHVSEIATGELVTMIEGGVRDSNITNEQRNFVYSLLKPILKAEVDTLILGCTHFPHLTETISALMPDVKLVSSSEEGALDILKYAENTGGGKTYRLFSAERK